MVLNYDEAERLKKIRHKDAAEGDVFLKLAHDYHPRGRLIEEHRQGENAYWLTYKYDQGGNRTWKQQFDPEGEPIARTHYRYDTDEDDVDCDGDGTADTPPADCYGTKHNRLMYYETEVWHDDGQTTPGFRTAEQVWYEYHHFAAFVGNPAYIVRKVHDPENPGQYTHYGTQMVYNNSGTLWFIKQYTWPQDDCGEEAWQTVSIHEFRSVGRNMRMTMRRQEVTHPYWGSLGLIEPGTRRWYDYDGDEIYADVAIDFDEWGGGPPILTELAAHEPGIGSYDYAANAASYRHGDQIGSTRAVTGEPNGGPAPVEGRIVYTAFGERVWSDGTVGTRYQYAGAWGYQSELYEDASGNLPFVHVGHRWYDPATGRFLQRDPIGIKGGLNVYEYSWNEPLLSVDPDGLTTPGYGLTPGGIWVPLHYLNPAPTNPPTRFFTWGRFAGGTVIALCFLAAHEARIQLDAYNTSRTTLLECGIQPPLPSPYVPWNWGIYSDKPFFRSPWKRLKEFITS